MDRLRKVARLALGFDWRFGRNSKLFQGRLQIPMALRARVMPTVYGGEEKPGRIK